MIFDANDLIAKIGHMIAQHPVPRGVDGFIVPNSWDPKTGTVEFMIGSTVLDQPSAEDLSQPLPHMRLPVATNGIGRQSGVRGFTDAVAVPTECGWEVKLLHRPPTDSGPTTFDSPGAGPGEHWDVHTDENANVNVYVKHLNDAKAQKDDKGSLQLLAGALLQIITTGGITIVADDSNKTFEITVSSMKFLIDGTNNRIEIGNTGLDVTHDAVVTETTLQLCTNNIIASVQAAFNAFAPTVRAGSPSPAPPTVGPVTATGSQTVESEE